MAPTRCGGRPTNPSPTLRQAGGAPAYLTPGWPILEHSNGDRWDGRRPEWQYTIAGTDPVVVETWRHGQPWGAHLLTEEAASVLGSGQGYWMVSRRGEEAIVRPTPVVQVQREATERLWRRSVFGSPMALADTVFGASPPEPAEDAPSDPPTLPAPVLPPVDGSHRLTFSGSAQHTLGAARRRAR